mmetsp:Transcript_33784/g.96113  ORF Transcript_33784/g.96113 Transcript_33784/m.96113 type:complete len:209 (+) Transcript_33784:641-1267(+)
MPPPMASKSLANSWRPSNIGKRCNSCWPFPPAHPPAVEPMAASNFPSTGAKRLRLATGASNCCGSFTGAGGSARASCTRHAANNSWTETGAISQSPNNFVPRRTELTSNSASVVALVAGGAAELTCGSSPTGGTTTFRAVSPSGDFRSGCGSDTWNAALLPQQIFLLKPLLRLPPSPATSLEGIAALRWMGRALRGPSKRRRAVTAAT